jgi:predicted transcriptional regulator
MKKPATANDWLAVLSMASARTPDVVPAGYKTIDQLAAETGASITTTRTRIRAAVKAGAVECQKFNVQSGQKTYPTSHYRIL